MPMHKGVRIWRSKQLRISLYVLVIVFLALAVYFTFIYSVKCNSVECFKERMEACTRATLVNEEPEASWRYKITSKKENSCVVEVELLLAQEGELGIDEFQGLEMECEYPRGVFAYPEKDLTKCTGELKEELQGLVINKLHSYILENLDEFGEGIQNS